MIFLTVGSHEPFDRLVEAVDAWCAANPWDEVFGQITDHATYKPKHFRWVGNLGFEAYSETCRKAELFIAHAGMGSIITALDFAKPIVILPRRAHLQETRNDHQYGTAERLEGRPGVFVAYDEGQISHQMGLALSSLEQKESGTAGDFPPFAQPVLVNFLRSVIAG